ncbi:MAG: SulP family inorganic anion transporter [Nitratireductor sp.]
MLARSSRRNTAPEKGRLIRFLSGYAPQAWLDLAGGYSPTRLNADLVSGLTVAIVALPLSMAIAIASGVTPAMGLYTAIIGGFLVSAFGGSRFQIGGPAGAFIVLVAATVHAHGIDGLILATFLSGFIMMAAGFLRVGLYVKFIPWPVTVGFTAGIGIIILASQLHDLLGLTLEGPEPGAIIAKLTALTQALPTLNPAAAGLAVATMAVIVGLRHFAPRMPALLVAILLASLATWALQLPVETIGSRFGGIPRTLPLPALPALSWAKVMEVLPSAFSFALLGAIESLLSAVVADNMSGARHRSNTELVGQGIANIGSALFGGFCVTGTIARTATNVRSGATSPLSGMAHSGCLLAFMLVAAPLAAYVPLAALGGLLAVVAFNMIERHAIMRLLRSSPGDMVVLAVTFLLVVFRDLTEGILAGFLVGAVLFIDRMSREFAVEATRADDLAGVPEDVFVYRISGAFFFGAASSAGSVLDRMPDGCRVLIIDCSRVPVIDSTAANVLAMAVEKARAAGIAVTIAGATPAGRRMMMAQGLRPPQVRLASRIDHALVRAARG